MSLIYRGHAYQNQPVSVEKEPKTVQMIYRGHTFEYTRKPITPSANIAQAKDFDPAKLEKLIYRGQVFSCVPSQPATYRKPKAMNWRYEMLARGAFA